MNAQTRDTAPRPRGRRRRGIDHDLLAVFAGVVVLCLMVFLQRLPEPASPGAAASRHLPEPAAETALPGTAFAVATSPVAMLIGFGGDVQVRSGDGMSRRDAQAKLALHEKDAVQTWTRARALLRLGTDDYLELGERSLLVLDAGAADGNAAAPRRVTLLAGMLTGTWRGASGGAAPFELALPGARLSLPPGSGPDGGATFFASRHPDSTSSISLLSGRARLAGGRGSEALASGYGITLDERGNVRERIALPPAPDTLTPHGGTVVSYREVPPRVEFGWSTVGGLTRYRLRVASDAGFREVLLDERLDATALTLSSLRAGEIYWSVSAVRGRHEGRPSVPRRLRILRDSDPPALTVDALAGTAGPVVVRGRTEAGARVYVQGAALELAPDGDFETRIERRPGAFLLVVEAVDAAGNVSYDSRIVTARDAERAAVADADAAE